MDKKRNMCRLDILALGVAIMALCGLLLPERTTTLPAENITITDNSNYFTSDNVEGALCEIGATLNIPAGVGGFFVSSKFEAGATATYPHYRSITGGATATSESNFVRTAMPAITLTGMKVLVATNSWTSGSLNITLWVDNASTPLTITIPFGTTGVLSINADVILTDNQVADYKLVKNGTPTGTSTLSITLCW